MEIKSGIKKCKDGTFCCWKKFFFLLVGVLLCSLCSKGAVLSKGISPNLYHTVDHSKMEVWVDSVLSTMTDEEKVGQLFFAVVAGDDSDANRKRIVSYTHNQHIGGLLFSKGTPFHQIDLTNMAQQSSKIPLMITADAEWGLSMRLSNTIRYPRNMMLGAICNDSLLYVYGEEMARECRRMGIHVNFAPDMDVNTNPDNPVIGTRSFGEIPTLVAKKGILYAKGLETGGVMAVAKHFPGHGNTSEDSHKRLPVVPISADSLYRHELLPFRNYIESGLSGLMVGHLFVPALDSIYQPSSLSFKIVTGLLKNKFSFSGLVFTDGLQMKGVSNEPDFCLRALLSGNDVLLGPAHLETEYGKIVQAVKSHQLSESLLNEKCRKILSYKYILHVSAATIQKPNLLSDLNSSHAIWLNRELRKNAVTLLKDSFDVVPLRNLDKRTIAAVTFEKSTETNFLTVLSKYTRIKKINFGLFQNMNAFAQVVSRYNTIIIPVNQKTDSAKLNEVVSSLKKVKKDVIIAFFDQPYAMTKYALSLLRVDAVMMGYDNDEVTQDYVAQAIFGGNDITGILPVSVKGLFAHGSGIKKKK